MKPKKPNSPSAERNAGLGVALISTDHWQQTTYQFFGISRKAEYQILSVPSVPRTSAASGWWMIKFITTDNEQQTTSNQQLTTDDTQQTTDNKQPSTNH